MPSLDDLLPLIPIFVSGLIGSWIQDFVITFTSIGKGNRFITRVGIILVGAIMATFIVGFGVNTLFPTMDWKLTLLASLAVGFTGFRLADIFSKTFLPLDLFGLGNLSNSAKLAKIEIDEVEPKGEHKP